VYSRIRALAGEPLARVSLRREVVLGVFIDVPSPWGSSGQPVSMTISGLTRRAGVLYVTVSPGPPQSGAIAIFEALGIHYWDVVAIPRRVMGRPLPRRVVVTVGEPCVRDGLWYRCARMP
jgi:hypothetical protein